jgi:serine/threonine protein kinase
MQSKRNRNGQLNIRRNLQLQLDTERINDENDQPASDRNPVNAVPVLVSNSDFLDIPTSPTSLQVFRREGISIGCDFLRINGETYTRDLLHAENIRIHEMIGHGAFSTVYRGTWHPIEIEISPESPSVEVELVDSIDVAIKIWSFRDLSSAQRQKMLLQELRTLSSALSEGDTQSSLVQLYGAFWNPERAYCSITLVLEYMDRGSLEEFIRKEKCDKSVHGLSEIIVASILYQILLGLSVLHNRRILHRDLKPANVLLHSNGQLKLCDFGIATPSANGFHPVEDLSLLNRTVVGTTKFMSPERLRAQPYGRSSDIWSFGCIIYQCLTRSCLWSNVHSMVDLIVTMEEMTVVDLLEQLHRMRFRNNPRDDLTSSVCPTISEGLQEVLVGCLQLDPGKQLIEYFVLSHWWNSNCATKFTLCHSAKRIPARLLLQSPWFSQEQDILHHDDAIERLRQHLEQNTAHSIDA